MNLHGTKGWLAGVAIAIGVTLLAIIGARFYGSDGAEEPLTDPAIVNTVATSVAATDGAPAATADTFSVAADNNWARSQGDFTANLGELVPARLFYGWGNEQITNVYFAELFFLGCPSTPPKSRHSLVNSVLQISKPDTCSA